MADDYTGDAGDNTFTDDDTPDASNTISGGDGEDTLNGADGHDAINGDGDDDALDGGSGNDTINGGSGNDQLAGGTGNDRLFGDMSITSPTDVTLNGGADTIDAGDGDAGGDQRIKGDGDILTNGNATLDGGDDKITGGDELDLIWGDGVIIDCSLVCLLNGGADTINGGEGAGDAVTADGRILDSSGIATLIGGNDKVTTGSGADGITGDGSVATSGSGGTATLTGGIDLITSGAGDDLISGDGSAHANNGTATVNGGADVIDAGDGNDTIVGDGWASATGFTSATLNGGADTIHGGTGNDLIYGETDALSTLQTLIGGNDVLYGDGGNDTIHGQSGNDRLFGGDGDDTLDGGTGNDYLCGDAGTNTLTGGSGADLRCAVDDNITVTEDGGIIDVTVNEQLDDADDADRAGRRYAIISISGDIKAVMDTETGRLTIISADSDGQVHYKVWLLDGGFESFATVFIALSRSPEEPKEEPEPEAPPPPVVPISELVPAIDVLPETPAETPTEPTSADQQAADLDPADGSGERFGDAVREFMSSPLAPAAEVTLATTIMMAVTGGTGLAGASLANARTESSEERAPNKRDGTKDKPVADFAEGPGRGDRSMTWRTPGHAWLDNVSRVLPVKIAPHSPLLGRLTVDGAELRAMFGTLWAILPLAGVGLGIAAAQASASGPLVPPLWLLIAGAVLTTFDALAGAIASTIYIAAGILSGTLWDAASPDLVHTLLVYSGVAFLWTSIPLIGSAIRPFRRLGHGSFRYAWDVAADLAIAALVCGWVTRGLIRSMDIFAGEPTGLPEYANLVALIVLFCVMLRITTEHFATRLYRERLRLVEVPDKLPDATVAAALIGVSIRTAIFGFIGFSFIGNCWQWWLGVVLYFVPQALRSLELRFNAVEVLDKYLPRGITALFIVLLVAAASVHTVSLHTASPLETMRWVFVLLAIPPMVLIVLDRFTEDDKRRSTGWVAEILGLGVVLASAWLAFNGWNA